MPKLGVVITAYNRADFVERCVRSVLGAAHDGVDVRVWVMDNGSMDNTAEVAREAGESVGVLRTEDNRHIVEVLNRGLARALEDPDVDCVMVMNEDTEFASGSIERMIAACDARPGSLLTPLQLNFYRPEELDDNAYGHVRTVRPLVEDALLGRPLREVYPLPTIIGAAMLAKRAVWERIGGFDPLFWFYGIDDDLCARARWLGYETLLVPEARLFHAHGKLDTAAPAMTREARMRKWRNETQARFLFTLKNPDRAFARNVLALTAYAVSVFIGTMWARWPAGAWNTLRIYGHCLGRLGRIARTRRRHFDPARRGEFRE